MCIFSQNSKRAHSTSSATGHREVGFIFDHGVDCDHHHKTLHLRRFARGGISLGYYCRCLLNCQGVRWLVVWPRRAVLRVACVGLCHWRPCSPTRLTYLSTRCFSGQILNPETGSPKRESCQNLLCDDGRSQILLSHSPKALPLLERLKLIFGGIFSSCRNHYCRRARW